MTEQTFSAEENLAFIRGVMEKAKKRTTQAGPFLAVWGTLSSVVTLCQYLAVAGNFPMSYMPVLWAMFILSGVSFSIIYGRRLARGHSEVCGDELITSNLFMAIGISIGVFFFANVLASALGIIDQLGVEICYVISLVMAIGFYGASYSTGISWLRYVAYGWWAAVILFVLRPFDAEYLLLIIAALDFLLLAVPGFKLMAMSKHHNS